MIIIVQKRSKKAKELAKCFESNDIDSENVGKLLIELLKRQSALIIDNSKKTIDNIDNKAEWSDNL